MTAPIPVSGFCPIHVENFLALMDNFPPFLRASAAFFWTIALMRCRRFSTENGLQRGQFYYGRDALARQLGVSPKTILTLEKRFQNGGEIVRESTNERTTLTLLKFDSYVIDENINGKRLANERQTVGNKPKEKVKEKETTTLVASHDAIRCLKAWEQYRPIIEKHRETYLQVFDDLHRLDKIPWEGEDGIFAICALAVKEWTAGMIQAPSKLRKPSQKYPELKTCEVIRGQIGDHMKEHGAKGNGVATIETLDQILADRQERLKAQDESMRGRGWKI